MHKIRDFPIERKTHAKYLIHCALLFSIIHLHMVIGYNKSTNITHTPNLQRVGCVLFEVNIVLFFYNKSNSVTRNFRFVLYAVHLRVLKKHILMTRMTLTEILLYDVSLKER